MIKVLLYGRVLGFIKDDNQHHVFEFSNEWLASRMEISPILYGDLKTRQLKTRKSRDTFSGLPEFLSDALPDRFGNKIIDAYFSQKEGVASRDITVLQRLSYLGSKAIGALEFSPVVGHHDEYEKSLEVAKLVEDARYAINGKVEQVSHDLIQIGSSAGGARPKALICANEGFSDIRSGLIEAPEGYTHYLIKFDGVDQNNPEADPKGYTNIEYAYFEMARASGIDMSPCFLLGESGRKHFVTQRFDRPKGEKLHIQTLCAMTGIDFNVHQSGSYSDYFNVITALNLDYTSKLEAYRRMVFNVLAVNRDDHTKNFSFSFDRTGLWALAPAYDVTHAYNELNPNAWTREHNLLINGKGCQITQYDLMKEARMLELSENAMNTIHEQILEVLSRWNEFAERNDVTEKKQRQIARHLEQARADFYGESQ